MEHPLAVQAAEYNQAYLYQIWFGLGGNTALVARATGVRQEIIQAFEHDYQWRALAGGKLGLADKQGEKDVNRAVSYAQGRRLSSIIHKALEMFEEDPARLRKALFTVTEDGREVVTAKPLVEIAKAMEVAHSIQYRALGDKVAEEADGVTDHTKIKNLSISVINAVNNSVARTKLDPGIVVDSVS